MIKNSKILIVFLLNLTLILSAIFYVFFLTPTSIFAESNNCYVETDEGDSGRVEYPYSEYKDDPEFSIKLTVDYPFDIGDTITYYYLRTDSNSLKYKTVEGIKVVTEENKLTAGDIEVCPHKWEGIGSYDIFARVWDNSKHIDVRANSITLVFEKPLESEFNLKIFYKQDEIQEGSNGLKTYLLRSEVELYDGNILNSDDYIINWYVVDSGNRLIGNTSSIYWDPPEAGNYTIFAEIKGMGVKSQEIMIFAYYNQTEAVLFGILGIAVIMTLFVIITTIIKVKGERIW